MKFNAFTPMPEEEELHLPELIYWASLGDFSQVKICLAAGVDVNLTDDEGYSALQAAAENGYLDIVEHLVLQGADVNYKAQYTALDLAKMSQHNDIVDYLSKL